MAEPEFDEIDFDAVLAQIDRKEADLKEAERRLVAVTEELADSVEEPRESHSQHASTQPAGPGTEASSIDRSARVGVDVLGIVAVVHIAPDAYRSGTTTRLAAAITEAAERAARQMYDTRMVAVESEIGEDSMPNVKGFFPTPVAPEPANPVAPPPPAYMPPPPAAPAGPAVSTWNPISGRPGEKVVGPSDWDDEMGDYGGGQQQSWLR